MFDRELRTLTNAKFTDKEVHNMVLTAMLICDWCYAANSNLAESKSNYPLAVDLCYEFEKAGLCKILTTTECRDEFLESRQRLYHNDAERYPMYFNPKELLFPARPKLLMDSTTEVLQASIINTLGRSVPTPLAPRVNDIKNAIRNRDENAITINVLKKMTSLSVMEAYSAGLIISESYNQRYLNALNGCLLKGLPFISHFDKFSDEIFYYQLFNPTLENAFIRFICMTDDVNKQVALVTALKESQEYGLFIDLLYSIIAALIEGLGNDNLDLIQKIVYCEIVAPLKSLNRLDAKLALDVLVSSYDNIRLASLNKYNVCLDLTKMMEEKIKTVLYIVATDTEFMKVVNFYKHKGVQLSHLDFRNIYWDLGMIRKTHVYLTKSGMGAKRPDGAILTINQAAVELAPDYMIMIGIAFGLKENEENPDHPKAQKLGDILVSTEIEDYGTCKITDKGIVERGSRIPADPDLLKRFTQAVAIWQGAKVRPGLIVTNDNLVNKKDFVKGLQERFKDAIGGEMEGCGFLANYKNPWILIKGICDFGHDKGDEYQEQAADNAISYVDFVLREFDL